MRTIISTVLVLLFSTPISAQYERQQYIHKHLMRADASIVSGYMYKSGIQNVHVNGNLEYYMDNKISFRGDANYLLGSNGISDSMGFLHNHSVMLGTVFHIQTKGHFDPYFILQPGIAYTQSYKQRFIDDPDKSDGRTNYPGVLSPLGTAGLGFNYYFQRFAHLFMEARYVYGQHLAEAPYPLSLEEVRITFGLGFNAFIIKEKKKPE
ncbi:MAG: hypothetical protein J0L87_15205 [Bacteroidetes bacterium]|nr:hypothetical protein [Bacteroidota bacterium]